MRLKIITFIVNLTVFILGTVLLVKGKNMYNGVTDNEKAIVSEVAAIETQYLKRIDMIPALIGSLEDEESLQKTVVSLINAGTEAANGQTETNSVTPEFITQFVQAQLPLKEELDHLFSLTDSIPSLASNEEFLKLKQSYSDTEAEINSHLHLMEKALLEYNEFLIPFPNNILRGMFHIQPKDVNSYISATSTVPSM